MERQGDGRHITKIGGTQEEENAANSPSATSFAAGLPLVVHNTSRMLVSAARSGGVSSGTFAVKKTKRSLIFRQVAPCTGQQPLVAI